MSRYFPRIIAFAFVVLTSVSLRAASSAGGGCYSHWSEPWKNNYVRVHDDAMTSAIHSQVWASVEGMDGYMFFATNDGLAVWDGVRWRLYRNAKNNMLRALYYDAESGRIYSAGVNEFGYWILDERGLFAYTSLFHNENFRQINYEFWRIVAPMGGNGIYFESFYNIYRYDPRGEIVSFAPSDRFRYMFLDGDEVCFQDGSSLYSLFPFGGRRYICDVDNRIINIYRNSRGERVLLIENSGAMILDDKGGLTDLNITTNLLLNTSHIICSSSYDDTHILIGTSNGGVYMVNIDSGRLDGSFIYNEDGIYDNAVLSVTADSSDNIWMGLNAGVIRITRSDNEFYLHDRMLGKINSMLECQDGSLLMGTTKGLYRADTCGGISIVGNLQGPVWEVVNIDGVVMALHDSGVYQLENDKLRLVLQANGALHIERFCTDTACFLVGEYNGLSLVRLENGNISSAWHIENHQIYSNNFCIDAKDRVWLPVSEHEISCLTLSEDKRLVMSMKNYPLLTDDAADGHVFCSHFCSELIICGGSMAYSIDYEHDTLVYHNMASQILRRCSDHVRSLLQYDNNFWYVSDSDVGYIKYEENNLTRYSGIFASIPMEQRMAGTLMCVGDCIALSYPNGAGFFAGTGRKSENPQLGSAAVLGVNGELLYYDMREAVFNIPSSMDVLRLYPVKLGADRIVEYRIGDSAWRTERIEDYLQFISLPYGRYTISMRMPGQEEPENWINLTVFKKRPWYSSVVAICLYIFAIILFTLLCDYLVHLWRRQQKKHREELEQLAQDNIEKHNQIVELAAEYQSLTKKVENISAELMNANKKLANVAIEKINDNYPDDVKQHIEQYFNIIYDGMFDKLTSKYPQLSKTDLKLCAYIKLNLSTKEIAALLNISPRSVEMGRYRLRKKLRLEPNDSLNELLQQI